MRLRPMLIFEESHSKFGFTCGGVLFIDNFSSVPIVITALEKTIKNL